MDGILVHAAVRQNGAAAGQILSGSQVISTLAKRQGFAERLRCIPLPALTRAGRVADVPGVFFQIFIEVMTHLNHSHHPVVRFPDSEKLGRLHLALRRRGRIRVSDYIFQPFCRIFCLPQRAASVIPK